MKRKTFMKQRRGVAMAACALLMGAGMMQSCVDRDDEILTGQPDWLGNSIYERLEEEGNYTYMLRLIDDLNQKEVLGHTGSKTLFPANDESFEEWFRSKNLSYEQLSTTRKKLILNNSMINNAYLIALMSNVAGDPPKEALAMRRTPAGDPLDSVRIMTVEEMPNTQAWQELRKRGKSQAFVGHGLQPMIHFLPPFMKYYKITDDDLSVLTNHQATSANESWINGRKVVEADITCKNGYIHRVDGVVESSPNMAEIIHQHPKMSIWARLMDRFSAPYPVSRPPYRLDETMNDTYNSMYKNSDSLFYIGYFNRQANHSITVMPDNKTAAPALLAFDPAWNEYMYTNTMGYDMHYDAGAMFVPTNEAVMDWWNTRGKDLQDEYVELDSIPYKTLVKLINVNMLDDFTGKVPSKFNTILDDAKEQLGITSADIDSCFMGCNGIVYMVNKVFSPREYASVAYPALAHESIMDAFYWAVEQGFVDEEKKLVKSTFLPYLLSMDAEYAFLMPTNDAMKNYIDPSTYGTVSSASGLEAPDVVEFSKDKSKTNEREQMVGSRYNSTIAADGTITKGTRKQAEIAPQPVFTMLDDMLNQMIIVLPVKGVKLETYLAQGYRYFKTKGGSLIYAEPGTNGEPAFAGGWQLEHGKLLATTNSFPKDNGTSYQLDEQMPLGATKSLFLTLKEHKEYEAFLNLISCDYSNMLLDKLNGHDAGMSKQNSKNFSLFDNYNYTVFVPTSESITDLQDQGILPTWRELTITDSKDNDILDSIIVAEHWKDASEITDKYRDTVKVAIRSVITNFVRYHVQDRSLAIGMAPEPNKVGNVFESMLRNTKTGRFYQLTTDYNQTSMTVKDVAGNVRTVQTKPGLYNNMVREYYFQGASYNARLFMGSDAMVHLIDKPLFVSNTHRKWQDVAKEYLDNNK